MSSDFIESLDLVYLSTDISYIILANQFLSNTITTTTNNEIISTNQINPLDWMSYISNLTDTILCMIDPNYSPSNITNQLNIGLYLRNIINISSVSYRAITYLIKDNLHYANSNIFSNLPQKSTINKTSYLQYLKLFLLELLLSIGYSNKNNSTTNYEVIIKLLLFLGEPLESIQLLIYWNKIPQYYQLSIRITQSANYFQNRVAIIDNNGKLIPPPPPSFITTTNNVNENDIDYDKILHILKDNIDKTILSKIRLLFDLCINKDDSIASKRMIEAIVAYFLVYNKLKLLNNNDSLIYLNRLSDIKNIPLIIRNNLELLDLLFPNKIIEIKQNKI